MPSSVTDLAYPIDAVENATGNRRGGWVVLLVIAVVALMLAFFALAVGRSSLAPQAGGAAPDFTLAGFDGQAIDLAKLRGQVVLVNFWASWCVPCAQEAAALESIWQDYRDRGLAVVGVAYTDTDAAAQAYLARHGVTYPNGPDRQARVSRAYHISGVPETFLIDRAGRIVPLQVGDRTETRLVGPVTPDGPMPESELRRRIEALLAGDAG